MPAEAQEDIWMPAMMRRYAALLVEDGKHPYDQRTAEIYLALADEIERGERDGSEDAS